MFCTIIYQSQLMIEAVTRLYQDGPQSMFFDEWHWHHPPGARTLSLGATSWSRGRIPGYCSSSSSGGPDHDQAPCCVHCHPTSHHRPGYCTGQDHLTCDNFLHQMFRIMFYYKTLCTFRSCKRLMHKNIHWHDSLKDFPNDSLLPSLTASFQLLN